MVFESGNYEMELRKSPISFILFIIAAIVFTYFTIVVKISEPLQFDQTVSSFLTKIFSESSYPFFKLLNLMGSSIGIGLTTLIAVAVLWLKKRAYLSMSMLAIAVSTGALLNKATKNLIGRPRPETEHLVYVKSLSGHAMMTTILYLLLAYFIARNIHNHAGKLMTLFIAVVVILLMGISRVVLQVHYPSDVVAGFALGFIWVFIAIFVYEFFHKKLVNTK